MNVSVKEEEKQKKKNLKKEKRKKRGEVMKREKDGQTSHRQEENCLTEQGRKRREGNNNTLTSGLVCRAATESEEDRDDCSVKSDSLREDENEDERDIHARLLGNSTNA